MRTSPLVLLVTCGIAVVAANLRITPPITDDALAELLEKHVHGSHVANLAKTSHSHMHRHEHLGSEREGAGDHLGHSGTAYVLALASVAAISFLPMALVHCLWRPQPAVGDTREERECAEAMKRDTVVVKTAPPVSPATLQILVAFAAGGLLGDVFFHLLPHAFQQHPSASPHPHVHADSHPHAHDSGSHAAGVWTGGVILAGILLFYAVEQYLRLRFAPNITHAKAKRMSKSTPNQSTTKSKHSATSRVTVSKKRYSVGVSGKAAKARKITAASSTAVTPISQEPDPSFPDRGRSAPRDANVRVVSHGESTTRAHGHHHHHHGQQSNGTAVTRYLNLMADTLHNFTDGVAITSAFLASHRLGWSTAAAVLLHELPHELGDVAVLIHGGATPREAMHLQHWTAMGAIAGVCLTIAVDAAARWSTTLFAPALLTLLHSPSIAPLRPWLEGVAAHMSGSQGNIAEQFILPFTAGGFLYIALGNIVPELLQGVKGRRTRHPVTQLAWEVGAMLVGMALMALIALYE